MVKIHLKILREKNLLKPRHVEFFSHQTLLYTYLLIPWFSLSFHYIRILHIHSDESGDNLPSLFKKRGLDPPRLHVGKISCLSFFSIDETFVGKPPPLLHTDVETDFFLILELVFAEIYILFKHTIIYKSSKFWML